MTGMTRALLVAVPLALAPTVEAKIKSADQMKAEKAYLLVQVEPVEFQMMGNNRLVTGVTFAPYDPVTKQTRESLIARKDPVAKDGKRRLYLVEIDPGTWVIAGTAGSDSQMGSADTSFSLGSYHFEARAGELVDLGVFVPQREESDNPDTRMNTGNVLGMAFFGASVEPVPNRLTIRPRGTDDIAIPAWLAAKPLVKPAFVYGGTFGNNLGGLINRIDGKAGRGRAAGAAAYLSKPGQPEIEVPSSGPVIEPATAPASAEPPATPSSLP